MNAFDFLLSLITFDWLRHRHDSVGNADNWGVMLSIKGACQGCDDNVYFDTFDVEWKHLSTRKGYQRNHQARPIPAPAPTPPDERLAMGNRLLDIQKEIAALIAASDRLALAPIPEATAREAMDRINSKIAALQQQQGRLQVEADLFTARTL